MKLRIFALIAATALLAGACTIPAHDSGDRSDPPSSASGSESSSASSSSAELAPGPPLDDALPDAETPPPPGELKVNHPAGIGRAPEQGAVDPAIVGTWALAIPGVSYQTEGDGKVTTTSSTGGGYGTLTIADDRTFTWERGGQTVHGALVQVIPNNGGDAARTYWRVFNGNDVLYVTADNGGLDVYNAGTNLVAATATKVQ